ncbi:sugar phosphate isomerase/epimerase family protein [Athalassotoga sp.]|uniref:sugar phosphate isomerase/epimerase family protein n=1 Tax=Athalassotoga sp. TaxID=2022597 RepID=UPI003CFF78BB
MKLGFLTVPLGNLGLDEIAKWASEIGFQTLEIGAWPVDNRRDYSSSTLDVKTLDEKRANEFKALFKKYGLEISSLAYYDNNLDTDQNIRSAHIDHLKKVIDAANLLGVKYVGTFIGRDIEKDIVGNMKEIEKVFPPVLEYAKRKNVQIMIENCPMVGWQKSGIPGELFYSPELWRAIFEILPDLKINLDPSHLYWLDIDYVDVVNEFADKIVHTHAKDTQILQDGLYEHGIFGPLFKNGKNWWRYRIPGLGEIDWKSFISALQENGYNGVVSIEHEDPVWEGSIEKVKKGLILGYRHLSQFII